MKRTKTAYLKEDNLLTLISQNNFIIPEIQREYVWGNNEGVIRGFLRELKRKMGDGCATCFQPQGTEKINIGFLYSYKPDYVKVRFERFLDENLIDGQQRFTTLFLLLFVCALKEHKKKEFLSLIRFDESGCMSFNFKVRDLTRKFLFELVQKIDSPEELAGITSKTWFLTDYKNDVSIRSMINALSYISEEFSGETRYFNQLLSKVVFWHFKTEATSQGEELYITMNARGEELADNEITKADLMLEDSQLLESGRKWEKWQQFFWKHRDKKSDHQSADKGFNGFLDCIKGLELYLRKYSGGDTSGAFTLQTVEKYYEALVFLEEHKQAFKSGYTCADWVDDALSLIWSFYNENSVDWSVEVTDENKGTDRSRMVFVWSVLHYMASKSEEGPLNYKEVFRLLRVYFMKYHNYDRSVVGIVDYVRSAFVRGPWGFFTTEEERRKYEYLSGFDEAEVVRIEQKIWEIEDHKLNQNGRDLGAVNISHLVDLTDQPTFEDLSKVKSTFEELFPEKHPIKVSKTLLSLLLFKGKFWRDTSTSYYSRYNYSDWRRTIRNERFKVFFDDYMRSGISLEACLKQLQTEFLSMQKELIDTSGDVIPVKSYNDKMRYLAVLLDPKELWACGEIIAVYYEPGEPFLFDDGKYRFYNLRTDFRSSYLDINEKVFKKYGNNEGVIEHLKQVSFSGELN